tara:strand:- start:1008 stop:1832 length:825 start_codon:yes stop_codon:yes gene_type:complete
MSNTVPAKKAPGRPAKATQPKAVPTAAPLGYSVKQVLNPQTTKFYEIVSGGGIVCRIKSEVTIYDAVKQQTTAIRYCPNEKTIYRDEQSSYARREHVVFRDKMLAVEYTNPNLINFLKLHPDNIANGGDVFKLIDNSDSAEKDLDKEFNLHDAISLIKNKDIQELLPVALSYGINVNQKNAEIKRELLRDAKSNPEKFIKMFDNPEVLCRSAVMQATDFQILKLTETGVYWYDTNRLIVSCPPGTDPTTIAVRFLLTEKGSSVYDQVVEQLNNI